MKTTPGWTRRIVGLVTACLLLVACGGGGAGGGGSASDAVKKYVTALTRGDTKTALECIAPERRAEAGPMLEMGAALASGFANSEGGLDSVTILNQEVEGDRALVGYQTKTKQGMERSDNVRAEKVNGSWYVAP